jgi:hypothetical protein
MPWPSGFGFADTVIIIMHAMSMAGAPATLAHQIVGDPPTR